MPRPFPSQHSSSRSPCPVDHDDGIRGGIDNKPKALLHGHPRIRVVAALKGPPLIQPATRARACQLATQRQTAALSIKPGQRTAGIRDFASRARPEIIPARPDSPVAGRILGPSWRPGASGSNVFTITYSVAARIPCGNDGAVNRRRVARRRLFNGPSEPARDPS